MADTYTAHDDEEMKPLMVHVTAPANLQGGYTFEALLNDDPDRPFTCEVVRSSLVSSLDNEWIPAYTNISKAHMFCVFSLFLCSLKAE